MSRTIAVRPSRRAVDQILLMSVARIMGHLASTGAGFVNAYVLGPAQLGVLKTIGVVSSYATYNDLGVMKGMYRDLPIALGARDQGRLERLANTAATTTAFTSMATVAVLWILYAAGITFGILDGPILALVSLILLLEAAVQYYDFYAKGVGAFELVAQRDLFVGLLSPAVGIPLLLLWRIPGLLASFVIIYAAQIVVMQRGLNLHVRPKWDWIQTKALARTGAVMTLNSFVGQIYWTVDLTVLASMASPRDVGIFGFALGGLALAEILPSVVNRIAFQRMGVLQGTLASDKPSEFARFMRGPWQLYLLSSTVVTGVVYLMYSLGTRVFLPQFADSVEVLAVLGGGYLFYTARGFTTHYLNVTDRMARLALLQIVGLGTNFALDIMLIPRFGVMGAAIGSAVSYVLFSFLVVYVVLGQVFGSRRPALMAFARLAVLFPLSVVAMVAIGRLGLWAIDGQSSLAIQVATAAIVGSGQFALYLAVVVGAFLLGFRGMGLTTELRGVWDALRSRLPFNAAARGSRGGGE